MLGSYILTCFVTFTSSLSGKLDKIANSASSSTSHCTTLTMIQKNGSLTDKINERKKARAQRRKEVMQDSAEIKNLKAKKRRLQARANGMSRDQMVSMWDLWQEGDKKKQAKLGGA